MNDHLVAVLERCRTPLPWWDVARLARRTLRWEPDRTSVMSALHADDRACWAGRGRYGLARHGLAPGVRDLGSAAGVYVHAGAGALTTAQIDYLLRRIGYRFSPSSLYPALNRAWHAGLVTADLGGWEGLPTSMHQRSAVIGVTGLRGAQLDAVLEALRESVTHWCAEWRRRVAV